MYHNGGGYEKATHRNLVPGNEIQCGIGVACQMAGMGCVGVIPDLDGSWWCGLDPTRVENDLLSDLCFLSHCAVYFHVLEKRSFSRVALG